MMFCKFCGKEVPEDANVCPYCGKELKKGAVEPQKVEEKPKKSSSGSGAQVLGVLSIIAPFIGLSFVGLILSIIGLNIDKDKQYKGLNVAGLVISIVVLVIEILVVILIIPAFLEYIEQHPELYVWVW